MPVAETTALRRDVATLCGVFVSASVAWAMAVGKDLSWDVVNHHLYQPFALLSNRFATDLHAANSQSYFNPLGYLPFYALWKLGGPSWLVGTIVAALQALVAVPLVVLARRIWPTPAERRARWMALLLSLLTPVFLITVGTSSADPWSNVLVLAALAIALARSQSLPATLLAGVLIGAACGMKPSNASFAIALGAVFAVRSWIDLRQFRHLLVYGASVAVGIAAAGGWWAWWLWTTFGNPVYPLFNQWFASPLASLEPMADLRFTPRSALDWLTRPAQWAEYRRYTYTEAFAPDLRPLAVQLLALPSAFFAWRRYRATGAGAAAWWSRPDAELAVFVAAGFVVWMAISGNGRYAMPLFMLTGLLVVRALQAILPQRAALVGALLLGSLQALYFVRDGEHRFVAQPWSSGPFIDVRVPPRLEREPFLHLSTTTPSYSAVALFLHPEGAFVNPIGPMSLPRDGPLGAEMRARLERWQGRTRLLTTASADWRQLSGDPKFRASADRIVYRLGLRFDWSDCEEIQIVLDDSPSSAPDNGTPSVTRLLSCRAVARTEDDPTYARDLAIAASAFAVIESQCPRFFGPRPLATESNLDVWQRRYVNTGARATVSLAEDVVGVSHFRSVRPVVLGRVQDVIEGRGRHACQAWQDLDVR